MCTSVVTTIKTMNISTTNQRFLMLLYEPSSHLSLSPTSSLDNIDLFLFSNILYKLNHKVCVLFGVQFSLAFFTQHCYFEIRPCCFAYQQFILFIAGSIPQTDIPQFIYLPANEYLGCFQLLVNTNEAAMNITHKGLFGHVFIFLEHLPSMYKWLGHMLDICLTF